MYLKLQKYHLFIRLSLIISDHFGRRPKHRRS